MPTRPRRGCRTGENEDDGDDCKLMVLEHRAAGDVTLSRVHQKVAGAPQGKTRAPDDANWS
jgi:hypothetical protein